MKIRFSLFKLLFKFLTKRIQSRFIFSPVKQQLSSGNRMFNIEELKLLNREKTKLETFDLYLYKTLNEPRLLGQIVFEYGSLINAYTEWKGKKVLDIGTGRSTLPYWMISQGASVTAFEYPKQIEKKISDDFSMVNQFFISKYFEKLDEVYGDMTQLPFRDNEFDLVTSFSVIEHLDTNPSDHSYVPYLEQRRKAAQTLNEMIRVTKPGGFIYLTSDCGDYARIESDKWKSFYYYKEGPEFSAAWPVKDVPEIFYDSFVKNGCSLIGKQAFDSLALNKGKNYFTFRGPFFSAFSVYVQKL